MTEGLTAWMPWNDKKNLLLTQPFEKPHLYFNRAVLVEIHGCNPWYIKWCCWRQHGHQEQCPHLLQKQMQRDVRYQATVWYQHPTRLQNIQWARFKHVDRIASQLIVMSPIEYDFNLKIWLFSIPKCNLRSVNQEMINHPYR